MNYIPVAKLPDWVKTLFRNKGYKDFKWVKVDDDYYTAYYLDENNKTAAFNMVRTKS